MRREESMFKGVDSICEIIGASFDNLKPIPARAWEDIRTRYEDLRDKYVKLRKVFDK